MSKTSEQIAASILKRVYLQLLQELPEPSCNRAKLKWKWQVDKIKDLVADTLQTKSKGMGIKIEL